MESTLMIDGFSREKDRAKLSWERCLCYENSPLVGMDLREFLIEMINVFHFRYLCWSIKKYSRMFVL